MSERSHEVVTSTVVETTEVQIPDSPYALFIRGELDDALDAARVVLYSIPDGKTGCYLDRQEWPFGEPVKLPEPFDLEIPTTRWTPWQ